MENKFKHYLKFVSLGIEKLYQITEPQGFDVSNFVLKQKTKGFGRDINYGNDNENLTFYDVVGELIEREQVIDVYGNTSNYLDCGLNLILESQKRFGFENIIEYHLHKNNVAFTLGLLDTATAETNNLDYFSCKIIQQNNISDFKKHEGTTLDMFGIKDVKGEEITPIGTSKVLRKSVSFLKTSKWDSPFQLSLFLAVNQGPNDEDYKVMYFNNCQNVLQDDLKYALSWYEPIKVSFGAQNLDIAKDFLVYKNKFQSKNIQIKISDFGFFQNFDIPGAGEGRIETKFEVKWGYDIHNPFGSFVLFSVTINEDENFNIQNQNYTINIPYLPVGANIWIYGTSIVLESSDFGGIVFSDGLLQKFKTEITAETYAFNTVVPMVRYIDMMRQCAKNINKDLPLIAPKFDIGGQFYNQFCFNRSLVGNDKTKPFNTTFKEIFNSVEEVNGDFEITKENIFVGQENDFYINEEIGVFNQLPSNEYTVEFNEKYQINIFKFGYKTFEQDRSSKNTGEAIHTEAEYIVPNYQVENKKEISCELIRDPYSQQVVVDLEIAKPSTSDSNDDKVYIVDVISLPAGSFQEIIANLTMQTSNGNYQILNREFQEDDEDEAVINWLALGIEFGDVVTINNFNATVVSITRTVLTILPPTGAPQVNTSLALTIKYFYNNVLFQTVTNEGFLEINGVLNPTTFPNLNYSIRRNLKHFESYLNTVCSYNRNGVIRNNYFKNNPSLKTRKLNETVLLAEKSDLSVVDLTPRILTPNIHNINVFSEFETVILFLEKYILNRGFIRCIDINNRVIKGYFSKLEYFWFTKELKFTIEEKFENEVLTLNYQNNILTVNDSVYNLSGVLNWFKISNEYLQVFDNKDIAICNPYRFDKVSLNSVFFNTPNELATALNSL
jgi:hypothetical protein